jgi:hypothetical protein
MNVSKIDRNALWNSGVQSIPIRLIKAMTALNSNAIISQLG